MGAQKRTAPRARGDGFMRVIIESPFAGDVEKNVKYAQKAMLHSIRLGESPLAFHLLYTQVLDDTKPTQRNKGIRRSFKWHLQADIIAIYSDLGVTPGMRLAIEFALKHKIKMQKRYILGFSSNRK